MPNKSSLEFSDVQLKVIEELDVLYFTTGKLVNFHHQKIEILE